MRLNEIKWNYLRRGFGESPLRNIQLRLHKERNNSALVYRSETWIPRKEYKVRLKSQTKFFTALVPPSRRIIDIIK
jgi:hypothetical protein